jgi:hypothetical protein
MYKLYRDILGNKVSSIFRTEDMAFIPLVLDNSDCIQFLKDWRDGATVTNPDGSPAIYSEEAVATLGLTCQD